MFFNFYTSVSKNFYINLSKLYKAVVQLCTKFPWNTLSPTPLFRGISMTITDAEKRILEYLRKNKEGDTFSGIAKATGMHRHTATKYIYKLIGEGKIRIRKISTAKVCYLKRK